LDTPEDDLYHKPTLVSYYERHNADVRDYFRHKKNLIEINVARKGDYQRLCEFLGKTPAAEDFPCLNASAPLLDESRLNSRN